MQHTRKKINDDLRYLTDYRARQKISLKHNKKCTKKRVVWRRMDMDEIGENTNIGENCCSSCIDSMLALTHALSLDVKGQIVNWLNLENIWSTILTRPYNKELIFLI